MTKLVPVIYTALFTLGQSSIDFLGLAWCAALPGSWNFYDDPPSSPFFGQVNSHFTSSCCAGLSAGAASMVVLAKC